jgi:hypothetical protein
MDIKNRIDSYLMTEQEEDNDGVLEMMIDLISSLDADSLDDEQAEILGDILESLGALDLEDEEAEDELSERRIMRVSRRAHVKSRKAYRMKRSKLKMAGKRYRRTAAYRTWQKKHKRMVKMGRTRKKKYV